MFGFYMRYQRLLALNACCLVFLSCNNVSEHKSAHYSPDSPSLHRGHINRFSSDTVENAIEGFWLYETDEFVTLVIEKDSIWYPDQSERFSYVHSKTQFIVNYKDRIDTFSYTMQGHDTLLIVNALGCSTYIRNRN